MLEFRLSLRRPGFELDVAGAPDAPITGLFGPSGAGKTTLLHVLAGIERPAHGVIRLGDRLLFDSDAGTDLPPHRRRIGVVFQDDRLFPHYSVRGNLRYGMQADVPPELRYDRVVELLELGTLLDRRIGSLSGGERRRVALGRALLSAPKMLLCDEPLAMLDVARRRQILPFIRAVSDATGIPMLYVSHELPELLQLTDRLMVLRDGRLAGDGRVLDLVHAGPAFATMHDLGLVNVIETAVAGHDVEGGLTHLAIVDGDDDRVLAVPHHPGCQGTVRVAIRPADVALALEPIRSTSIQNCIGGRVTRLTTHPDRAIVEVDVGVPVLVEVSLRTVTTLELAPGGAVWCLIKSNAVEVVSG